MTTALVIAGIIILLVLIGAVILLGRRHRKGWAIGCAAAAIVLVAGLSLLVVRSETNTTIWANPAATDGTRFVYNIANRPVTDPTGWQYEFETKAGRDALYAGVRAAYPDTTATPDGLRIFTGDQVYQLRSLSAVPGRYELRSDSVSVRLPGAEDNLDIVFPADTVTPAGVPVDSPFKTSATAVDLARYYQQFKTATVTDGGATIPIAQNGGYTLSLKNGEVRVTR